MKFRYKNRDFNIDVKRLSGIKNFTSGLMFVKKDRAKALLFDFEKVSKFSFTSLFVFFPFLMLWLDEGNNVLKIKKINPFIWKIPSVKAYYKVLEIPFNKRYKDIIQNLVGASTGKTFKKN